LHGGAGSAEAGTEGDGQEGAGEAQFYKDYSGIGESGVEGVEPDAACEERQRQGEEERGQEG